MPGVPDTGAIRCNEIGSYLEGELPAEAHPRIREAVGVLDAARTVRAGVQPMGARAWTIDAFARLGLLYSVSDRCRIQLAVAGVCDAIRDELQTS